jgi:phosphate transport system ATP-binding protein
MVVEKFSAWFGDKQALAEIDLSIHRGERLVVIGPAGSGKSTLLRCLNRLNDQIPEFRHTGRILLAGNDIYSSTFDINGLRRRAGMIHAMALPLPQSIRQNIVFGPEMAGIRQLSVLQELVETSLKAVALWDELKDQLDRSALELSNSQQHRLCVARILAMKPDVLLLDEPCAGLDVPSSILLEDLLSELKKTIPVVFSTNDIKQAARASEKTAFFVGGRLVEYSATLQLFTDPKTPQAEAYITGRKI